MAFTVTQTTGYAIDLGRYLKVAFALLGVHILAPTFFWDVFWVMVAAEIAYFVLAIASAVSLVQLWVKTYIVLVALAIGVLLTELILLVVLSSSMFPAEPWYGVHRIFFYGLVLLAVASTHGRE
jgi:hypothetical protein